MNKNFKHIQQYFARNLHLCSCFC